MCHSQSYRQLHRQLGIHLFHIQYVHTKAIPNLLVHATFFVTASRIKHLLSAFSYRSDHASHNHGQQLPRHLRGKRNPGRPGVDGRWSEQRSQIPPYVGVFARSLLPFGARNGELHRLLRLFAGQCPGLTLREWAERCTVSEWRTGNHIHSAYARQWERKRQNQTGRPAGGLSKRRLRLPAWNW